MGVFVTIVRALRGEETKLRAAARRRANLAPVRHAPSPNRQFRDLHVYKKWGEMCKNKMRTLENYLAEVKVALVEMLELAFFLNASS